MPSLINPRALVSLQPPAFLSRSAFAFAATAQLLLLGAHADVTFSGPNASPSLIGSSQTFSGVTTFNQPILYENYDDSTFTYINGMWDGKSIQGSKVYSGDGFAYSEFTLDPAGLYGTRSDPSQANFSNIYSVSWDGYLAGSMPDGISSAGSNSLATSVSTNYSIR